MLSHHEIKRVVLTNFPGCFQFWGIRSLDNQDIHSPEKILSDALSRTFKALSDAGKEVVYVLDAPTFSKDGLDDSKVNACAAKLSSVHAPALTLRSALYLRRDKTTLNEVCTMPESDNGTVLSHAMLKKLVEKEADKLDNIQVVDLTQLFCQDKTCSMIKNGKMLYKDSQHINRTGAAVVAPLVFKAFDLFDQ